MGDGRYYTIYQFSLSLIFIILAILTASFMMISYYKNKNKENGRYISVSLLLLLFCIILSFIENVIGSLNQGFILRCISKLCLIACLSIFTNYLFSYVLTINKFRIREVIIAVAGICAITIVTKGKLLITNYEFYKINYSLFYKVLLIVLFLFVLLSIYKILRSRIILHFLDSNKKLGATFTALYLFPIGVYSFFTISGYRYLDFIECSLYFLLIVFIIVITTEHSLGLTSKQFEELTNMLEDYVFVIDNKGNIVYKNDVFKKSEIFNNTNVVDINNIKLLFCHNVKIVNGKLGNNYIQLELEEKTKYFSYKNKELKDEERLLGYMVTITDITHILDLVNKLELNNREYIETNKRLSNYSNVVYQLEKEKEISILLEEIITTREKSMDDLVLMIDDLENNLDNNEFQSKLNKAIRLNIDILSEIRRAVTAYREHYGGD